MLRLEMIYAARTGAARGTLLGTPTALTGEGLEHGTISTLTLVILTCGYAAPEALSDHGPKPVLCI